MRKKIIACFLSLVIAASSISPAIVLADENLPVTESEDINETEEDGEETKLYEQTNTEEIKIEKTTTDTVAVPEQEETVVKAELVTNAMFSDATTVDDSTYERREVQDGVYMFSVYDKGIALSVQDVSQEDGAAMMLDHYTYKLSQQFEVTAVGDGWYKIINLYSNKALTVKGNSQKDRVKIELDEYTGADGQLWQFLESEEGDGCCYIKSKVGSVMNCTPGNIESGDMVHTHELDGLLLQRWKVEPAVDLNAAYIKDGTFELADYSTCVKVIAPIGYSEKASVSMVLGTAFGHEGGKFQIEVCEDGWYRIVNVQSGLALTVSDGTNGADVQQKEWNGSNTQLWRFIDAGNGSFYIQAKAGTFLSRQNGSTAEGTKIQMAALNLSSAQMWVLKTAKEPEIIEIQDGAEYLITSPLDANHVMEIAGASTGGAANVQMGYEELTTAQRFRTVETESGWYKLESVHSGMVIEIIENSIEDGANVIQNPYTGTDSQLWRFIDAGDGYCYLQSKSGMILECASDDIIDGTNIQVSEPEKTKAQKFKMCNISTENYINVTILTDYTARITLYSRSTPDIQSVSFPTWSVENGQDDIIWFPGVQVEDGIWSVEIDTKGMKAEDVFDICTHAYITTAGGDTYAGSVEYKLKAHLEGWIYVDGLRRYRLDDGSIMNDVSDIFNPDSKYITVDRIKGITTIYGYNSQTNAYDTPIKAMWCSVGNPISLTEAGTYSMGWQLKSKEMNASDGSYRCWASYVSQIYGPVYFHGVASDTPDLNTISAAAFRNLGNPASHGCVRLAAIDARWIYYNTGRGTKIKIGDNLASPMVPKRYQWVGGSVGPDPTYIP